MEQRSLHIRFDAFSSAAELPEAERQLLSRACEATGLAYAPYSRFRVGATAMLANGIMVSGANQENASFPAGICAERVLLSAISSTYPGIDIQSLAITHDFEGKPGSHAVAPCGVCRQSLIEMEDRMGKPLRIILGGLQGEVLVFHSVKDLLPFHFSGNELK